MIDETSKYGKYNINKILKAIVNKYVKIGKQELLLIKERAQVFSKQIKKVLGDDYHENFNF